MLRRIIIFYLFFLFLPLAGCYPQASDNKIKPEEKLEANVWDFGKVKEGVKLEHSFVLKNDSKKVLNIKDITTSCGCIGSTAAKKMLLPQESTTIKVKFSSKGYSGPVKQFIYVTTDNPDNPVLKFTIKADAVR